MRQVRVGVQRDPRGAQGADLRDGAAERLGRLPGQAVDEVGVDRLELQRARLVHQFLHAVVRLYAVHRGLHVGVEVLHAEADAVEADLGQVAQPLPGGGARVDLDRDLALRQDAERPAHQTHELCEFLVGKEGGRAAAQVQLRKPLPAPQFLHVQFDLARQQFQVARGAVVVLGDDLVAGAVVAERVAERDVHVQRQRRRTADDRTFGTLAQRLAVFGGPEGFHEAVGGGVGGVAWPRDVEAAQLGIGQRRLGGRGGGCIHGGLLCRTGNKQP